MGKINYSITSNEEKITLKDATELFALGICEDIMDENKRIEEITAKCKILDSLSNAIMAINA